MEKLPLVVFLFFLGCCFASVLPLSFRKKRGSALERTLVGVGAAGASVPFFALGGLVIAAILEASTLVTVFAVAGLVGAGVFLLAVLAGATRVIQQRVVGMRQRRGMYTGSGTVDMPSPWMVQFLRVTRPGESGQGHPWGVV